MADFIDGPEDIYVTPTRDFVISTNGVERARIKADGTATGLLNSQPLPSGASVQSTQVNATLGSELLTNPSISGGSTGWTLSGATYSANALHFTANGNSASQSIAVTSGQQYLVTWVQSPVGGGQDDVITVSIGAASAAQSPGGIAAVVVTAVADGSVTFSFVGTTITTSLSINNFSCKQITSASSVQQLKIVDATGTTVASIRADDSQNLGIGKTALAAAVSNDGQNTAVGYQAAQSLVDGLGNTALGHTALKSALSVEYCVAVGQGALTNLVYGFDNTAVGQGALGAITTGSGAKGHVAVGTLALSANTTGTYNTAVGTSAMQNNTSGKKNVAMGSNALGATPGDQNISIGKDTLLVANGSGTGSAADNVAIGYTAGQYLTTGVKNVMIGSFAGVTQTSANAVTTGNRNIHIGYQSGPGQASSDNSMLSIGYQATTIGSGSVAIGTDNGSTGASATAANMFALGTALHQIKVSNNTTGAGSAALGANSPATTNTAPYTWFKMYSSDGSTVYVPAWK